MLTNILENWLCCSLFLTFAAIANFVFKDAVAEALNHGPSSNVTLHVRVMTFNTWQGGANVDRGELKALQFIKEQNPDIVLLQEARPVLTDYLLTHLGSSWSACINYADVPDQKNVILTRFPVIKQYRLIYTTEPLVIGCQIRIHRYPAKVTINVWNAHLYWGFYGPYAACQKDLNSVYQLYLCERAGSQSNGNMTRPGRLQQLFTLFKHPDFWDNVVAATGDRKSSLATYSNSKAYASLAAELQPVFGHGSMLDPSVPMIFGGDFNSPSHLDWVDTTRRTHCGMAYKWPVSTLLYDYGFVDSYRAAHPDPRTAPGNTWSPIYKYQSEWEGIYLAEPQDRIDYIYYKGPSVSVRNSWVTHGSDPLAVYPKHAANQWPSDHSAVVTDFEILAMQMN